RDITNVFEIIFFAVGETDGVKSVSVMEGDPVTLNTDTEIHTDDLILWRFGDKGILLAKIDVETKETSLNDADERFKDRLLLDQTGSLTIKNTRTKHAGLYEVQIRGRESSQHEKTFRLAAFISPVDEGDSVTLHTNVTQLHKDDVIQWWYEEVDEKNLIAEFDKGNLILWTFGAEKRLIVKFDSGTPSISEKFRDRLKPDHQTGSVTIRNMGTTDSGQYKLQIINSEQTTIKRFNVSVTSE
uniref:Immunoglobulin domain-containing protein n=1 Tax=Sinocyclocheilus anshuiensis TaxID=1608454 RepID=A0A671S1Y4_9TELE